MNRQRQIIEEGAIEGVDGKMTDIGHAGQPCESRKGSLRPHCNSIDL